MASIRVLYTCRMCGLDKQGCDVAERGENVDIAVWFEGTLTRTLMEDHKARSPLCQAQKFNDVMIPIAGVNKVGESPKN